MPVTLPLKKMSTEDKLRAMEELWVDLSRNEKDIATPAWHLEALKDAKQAVANGTAHFVDWEVAKTRLRRRAARFR
jgi:hypothetical protein